MEARLIRIELRDIWLIVIEAVYIVFEVIAISSCLPLDVHWRRVFELGRNWWKVVLRDVIPRVFLLVALVQLLPGKVLAFPQTLLNHEFLAETFVLGQGYWRFEVTFLKAHLLIWRAYFHCQVVQRSLSVFSIILKHIELICHIYLNIHQGLLLLCISDGCVQGRVSCLGKLFQTVLALWTVQTFFSSLDQ